MLLQGPAPQGEQDTLPAAQRLIDRLVDDGARWGPAAAPAGAEQGVDFEATDDREILKIQVVRAAAAKTIWKELATQGKWAAIEDVDMLAELLFATVEHKTLRAQADVMLVLDAVDLAGLAFWVVADAFRRLHAPEAQAAGWQAIWVVGPDKLLVHRLDEG